jgi:diguanylate cyclase (GGDEF)-like protein/PAS domain S-box-containing protein
MIPTRILVVDDDTIVARDLSRILERLGYQVPAVVDSGDDAVRIARESSAELALFDADLPGALDGSGPAGRLRSELRIPVVYLTSEHDPRALRRLMTADPGGVLLKPFREEELRTVIDLAMERHRLESRLSGEERRFATALACVGDAVVTTDEAGRVTFVNPAAERLLATDLARARGRPACEVLRLVEPASGTRLPDPFSGRPDPASGAAPLPAGSALALPGRCVPVAGSVTSIAGKGGELLGWVATLREVREAAASRAGAEARTGPGEESSEERYSRIFRTSPAAITLTSLSDGRVIEVNEAFSHLSGWEPEEAVGATLVELGWWICPRDHAWLNEAARGDTPVEDIEMTFCTRSGQLRETLVSAERLHVDGEESLLTVIHDITARKELERELERHALHDPLTGLPNRSLFRDRLDHALDRVQRRGTKVAVLFLDLDGFKEVNDRLGHTRGDELLRAVADRVRGCVREGDTFARFGGDEFAAVLEPIDGIWEVRRVARRFAEALEAPIELGGLRIPMSASIGIAIGGPGELCPEELVRAADVAMYGAKEDPGTSFRLFHPSYGPRGARIDRPRARTDRPRRC